MEKMKNMLPYLLVIIIDFYVLPFIIRDTGSGMIMLLIVMPVICFISAVIYAFRNGFHLLFAIMTALLFIPTIFIFYNFSAWIYIVSYGITALLGNMLGLALKKSKRFSCCKKDTE